MAPRLIHLIDIDIEILTLTKFYNIIKGGLKSYASCYCLSMAHSVIFISLIRKQNALTTSIFCENEIPKYPKRRITLHYCVAVETNAIRFLA